MKKLLFTLCIPLFFLSLVVAQQTEGFPLPGDSSVLFHDSTDPRYYDQSVVTQVTPSTVVTESFDTSAISKDKLPVVPSPVKSGINALKLQWNSAPSGNWMALVGAVGWKALDLNSMSYLKFWVISSSAIDSTVLPLLHLEAKAGIPVLTGKVRLANYLKSGLTANVWTQVSVPLTDLWTKDLLFQSKDTIKGVIFSQNEVDNREHTLFMDEFTFDNTPITDNPSINEKEAYYVNGEIHYGNYSGHLKVYDLIGTLVKEGEAIDGIFGVNLERGKYIISTITASVKLVLP